MVRQGLQVQPALLALKVFKAPKGWQACLARQVRQETKVFRA